MWEIVFLFLSLNFAFILIGCNYYNNNKKSSNSINQKKVNLVPLKKQKLEKKCASPKKNNLEQKSAKINKSDGLPNSDTVKEKKPENNLVDISQTLDPEIIDEIQTEISDTVKETKPENNSVDISQTLDPEIIDEIQTEISDTVKETKPENNSVDISQTLDPEIIDEIQTEISDTVKETKPENNSVDISQTLDPELINEIQTEISESLNNNKILEYLNSSEFTKEGPDNLIYYNDSTNNTINVRNSKNSFFDIFIDSKEELKWPKGIEFIEYLNSEKKSSKFKDTSILVADNDNYVWEFYGPNYGNSEVEIKKRGKYRGIYSSGRMENPQDIILTPSGELLVASANNHRVLCYAGPNEENPGEFIKELFSLEKSNGKPSKMYLDSEKNKLYVKDSVNNKIEIFKL